MIPAWMILILGSAFALGFYDICKKHAVRENSVMPVLFFSTVCGLITLILALLFSGTITEAAVCSWRDFLLILVKAVIVGSSWTFVYYAMRELPISIASPIRASSPLWTFIGSIFLFHEIPTVLQGIGMVCIFCGYVLFSLLGKLEGISFKKHKGIHWIFIGTFLGACSALFDKYLLGSLQMSRITVQFWFSVDLVFLLGTAWLVRAACFGKKHQFQWRWTIPATGILLIAADYLYFYAVSLPETQIAILSLVRRSSCVITFLFGAYLFHDRNIWKKMAALCAILLGILLLALAK